MTRKFPKLTQVFPLHTFPAAHSKLHTFQFVFPAHELWVPCSMNGIDLIAFNLSSKAYLSVFNQHQGRKPSSADLFLAPPVVPQLVTTLQP